MEVKVGRSTVQNVISDLSRYESRVENAWGAVVQHFQDKGDTEALSGGESGEPEDIVADVLHCRDQISKTLSRLEKADAELALMDRLQPSQDATVTMSVDDAHQLEELLNAVALLEQRVAALSDDPLARSGYQSPAVSLKS